MFRTDCNKFYTLFRQKNTNVKNASTKEEIENFWKEILGKKRLSTMKKLTASKTSAYRMPAWNGAQYLKWRSQRH